MEHQQREQSHYQILNQDVRDGGGVGRQVKHNAQNSDIIDQENEHSNIEFATLPKGVGKKVQSKNKKNKLDRLEIAKPNEYIPEWAEFDFEAVKNSEYFQVKIYPEAVFMGEIRDGKREGRGIMKYTSNRVYEGDWKNDIRTGKGFERYTNNTYVGEFKKSKPWGKGVYKWSNGEVYDGEWYQGLKHGYGIWKGIFGDSYIGEWKNSRADGYGVHTWRNGDRYEGEWKQ